MFTKTKVLGSALAFLCALVLSGGAVLALGDGEKGGKAGPQPLSGADDELLQTRERMKEEYRLMREARLEALKAGAASANPNSRGHVPGWRAEDTRTNADTNPTATPVPAPEMPGPLGNHPFDAGKFLLITLGLGLTALITLRVVRSVKRGRVDRPVRPGAHIADGPITLTVRQRAKKGSGGIAGYDRQRTTSETSSSNDSTPNSSR